MRIIKIILLTIVLFIYNFSFAQKQQIIDSLEKVINYLPDNVQKIDALDSLSIFYEKTNIDTSIYYAKKSLLLTEKYLSKIKIAKKYNSLAFLYKFKAIQEIYNGDDPIRDMLKEQSFGGIIATSNNAIITTILDTSLYLNYKSLAIYNELENKISILNVTIDIVDTYSKKNDKVNLNKHSDIVIQISQELGDNIKLAQVYSELSTCYETIGDEATLNKYTKLYNNIVKSIGTKYQESLQYNNLGEQEKIKGNTDLAIEYFKKSLKLSQEIKSTVGQSTALNNLGELYYIQGKTVEALNYYNNSLTITERIGDLELMSGIYNNIGVLYFGQGNTEIAIKYYKKNYQINKRINNNSQIAAYYNNMGALFASKNNLNKALEFYNKSLVIERKIGELTNTPKTLTNIGSIYSMQQENDKALDMYLEVLSISDNKNNTNITDALYNVARIYKAKNNIPLFKKYTNKLYKISKKINNVKDIKNAASLMKELAIIEKDYKNAFLYYQEELNMTDSINNEETYKELINQDYKRRALIDSVSNAKKIEIANLKQAKLDEENKTIKAENKNQKIIIIFVITTLVILIISLFFIYKSHSKTKKINLILKNKNIEIEDKNNALNKQKAKLETQKTELENKNDEINTQNDEINTQNDEINTQLEEIEHQRNILEDINIKIEKSIDAALLIQKSLFPNKSLLNKQVSDSFVLFKPKDKVSGDFYWWSNIEDSTIVVAADCTGHGVPGAILSILGISLLRSIVQKEYISNTDVILRKLRKEVIKTLNNSGRDIEEKGGMDMAIVSINKQKRIMQFSGANNPIYIIKQKKQGNLRIESKINSIEITPAYEQLDSNNLVFSFYEIEHSRLSIGISERGNLKKYNKLDINVINENKEKFVLNEISLDEGDQIYMFSDGFADQFGGPKDKKFKYEPFQQLLLSNANKPMAKQKELLKIAFNNWLGTPKKEQIDDVLVLGLKI